MTMQRATEASLNWKKYIEREEGDPPPLLCPGDATFRILRLVLGSPVQKRHGSPRRSPAEGHKYDKGPGVSPA